MGEDCGSGADVVDADGALPEDGVPYWRNPALRVGATKLYVGISRDPMIRIRDFLIGNRACIVDLDVDQIGCRTGIGSDAADSNTDRYRIIAILVHGCAQSASR